MTRHFLLLANNFQSLQPYLVIILWRDWIFWPKLIIRETATSRFPLQTLLYKTWLLIRVALITCLVVTMSEGLVWCKIMLCSFTNRSYFAQILSDIVCYLREINRNARVIDSNYATPPFSLSLFAALFVWSCTPTTTTEKIIKMRHCLRIYRLFK